jgi:hypothetical protein
MCEGESQRGEELVGDNRGDGEPELAVAEGRLIASLRWPGSWSVARVLGKGTMDWLSGEDANGGGRKCLKQSLMQVMIDSCKWHKFHLILVDGICCIYRNHITKNNIVFPAYNICPKYMNKTSLFIH